MKTYIPSKKRGSVLVMAMVVMVVLTLMVAALLQLGSFNQLETVQQLRNTQAHWLAEAGLERGLSRVMGSKDYRDTLSSFSTVFVNNETLLNGLGIYEVEIIREPTINPLIDRYVITSTGTASNNAMRASNQVRVSLEAGPGGQQALMALGGNSTIQNTTVNGSIYQAPPGTLTFNGGNNSANDIIDAKGGVVNPPSGAEIGTLDPGPPTLDKTQYITNIQYAASNGIPGGTFNGLALGGGLNYYSNSVTINGNITGPGTIVVNGTVTFPNAITVGADVKIVAEGNVSFGNHITLKERTEIFTLANISFATQGATATNGTTLLAMGNIDPAKNIDFYGILYAEGEILATSGSNIRGTLIAGQGFDIAANCTITYDPSVFAIPNPINYGNSLAIQTGTMQWEEGPF